MSEETNPFNVGTATNPLHVGAEAVPTSDAIDQAGAAHLLEPAEVSHDDLVERVQRLETDVKTLASTARTDVTASITRLEKVLATIVHPTKWPKLF